MVELLLFSYGFGGIPAIISGLIVAWLVRRRSWISLTIWMVTSALIALVPLALISAVGAVTGEPRAFNTVLVEIITPLWITAILFASLGLRALLIASQVLLPPGRDGGLPQPATEDNEQAGA
jgi:hypothetical protein